MKYQLSGPQFFPSREKAELPLIPALGQMRVVVPLWEVYCVLGQMTVAVPLWEVYCVSKEAGFLLSAEGRHWLLWEKRDPYFRRIKQHKLALSLGIFLEGTNILGNRQLI